MVSIVKFFLHAQLLCIHSTGYSLHALRPTKNIPQPVPLSQLNWQSCQYCWIVIMDHRYRLDSSLASADLTAYPELQQALHNQHIGYQCYFLEQLLSTRLSSIQISPDFQRHLRYRYGWLDYSSPRRLTNTSATPLSSLVLQRRHLVKAQWLVALHRLKQQLRQVTLVDSLLAMVCLIMLSVVYIWQPETQLIHSLPQPAQPSKTAYLDLNHQLSLLQQSIAKSPFIILDQVRSTPEQIELTGTYLNRQGFLQHQQHWQQLLTDLQDLPEVIQLVVEQSPLMGDIGQNQTFQVRLIVKPILL